MYIIYNNFVLSIRHNTQEAWLLIVQSVYFLSIHARPFRPRCSKTALRGFQQFGNIHCIVS
nr:MAG TPA: hypothetical protein [Caudoviricetes sp.]